MVMIADARLHNRTALTGAISQMKPRTNGATHPCVTPMFSDPSVTTAGEGSRDVALVRDRVRRQHMAGRGSSQEERKQITLGSLDAIGGMLESLGHERLTRVLAEVRVAIEGDSPDRALDRLSDL